MCANSEGSGESARKRRLAWAFAGRLCDKYHNLMSWLIFILFVWTNIWMEDKMVDIAPLKPKVYYEGP